MSSRRPAAPLVLVSASCCYFASVALVLFHPPTILSCSAFISPMPISSTSSASTRSLYSTFGAIGYNGAAVDTSSFSPRIRDTRTHHATVSSSSSSTGQDGTDTSTSSAESSTEETNSRERKTSAAGGKDTKAKQKSKGKRGRRRPPPSKRTGLKWVVESVEKCLCEEKGYKSIHREDGSESGWNRDDILLVEALWKLCWSNSPKEISEAGARIESLHVEENASIAVQERVIKVVAVAGLLQLSNKILQGMLTSGDSPCIPSAMSYTALLNGLRRAGKIRQMENVLIELAEAYRIRAGVEDNNRSDDSASTGVDIIAFNAYLAALCDASVTKYESSRPRRLQPSPMRRRGSSDDKRSLNDYLVDAVDLLRPKVAREKFFTEADPDLRSYNTVLSCASRVKARSVVEEVLDLMKSSGMKGDIYTYNARLRLAIASGDSSDNEKNEALQLIDKVLADPNLLPDMYTIDLALVPLVRAGRIGEILQLLGEFESLAGSNVCRRYIDAMSSFLNTLVKANEVELARTLFDSYVLRLIPDNPPNPAELMPQIDSKPVPIGKIKTAQSRRLKAFAIHFNTLIEGYRRLDAVLGDKSVDNEGLESGKTSAMKSEGDNESDSTNEPRQCAVDLFDLMISRGVCPDAYTVTSMISLQKDSCGITELWLRALDEFQIIMTPIIYHALMTAYGRIGDPSSACWTFDRMLATQGRSVTRKSWNVFLGSLSNGSRSNDTLLLDIFSSDAAKGMADKVEKTFVAENAVDDRGAILRQVDGMDCAQAALAVLNEMSSVRYVPRPDSQSYCLVASAMSHRDRPCPDDAIELFRDALRSDIPPDGRFVNACIRCFGDQMDKAILAWKNEMRIAVLSHENRERPSTGSFLKKRKKNLAAAYHGLLYVCGKAGRPDIALRLVYAMNKEQVEPSETSYNSYLNGKEERQDGTSAIPFDIMVNQYESLLEVECLKYDARDKRREKEKRIRIIF